MRVASTKDSQFSADSKYYADHGPLLRFPYLSVGHMCKQTLH